jgi:hypothetical protein
MEETHIRITLRQKTHQLIFSILQFSGGYERSIGTNLIFVLNPMLRFLYRVLERVVCLFQVSAYTSESHILSVNNGQKSFYAKKIFFGIGILLLCLAALGILKFINHIIMLKEITGINPSGNGFV